MSLSFVESTSESVAAFTPASTAAWNSSLEHDEANAAPPPSNAAKPRTADHPFRRIIATSSVYQARAISLSTRPDESISAGTMHTAQFNIQMLRKLSPITILNPESKGRLVPRMATQYLPDSAFSGNMQPELVGRLFFEAHEFTHVERRTRSPCFDHSNAGERQGGR